MDEVVSVSEKCAGRFRGAPPVSRVTTLNVCPWRVTASRFKRLRLSDCAHFGQHVQHCFPQRTRDRTLIAKTSPMLQALLLVDANPEPAAGLVTNTSTPLNHSL
jgi:hypothetical protein